MMLRDCKGFRGTYFGFRLPAEPAFAETPAVRTASGGGRGVGRQVLCQGGI